MSQIKKYLLTQEGCASILTSREVKAFLETNTYVSPNFSLRGLDKWYDKPTAFEGITPDSVKTKILRLK